MVPAASTQAVAGAGLTRADGALWRSLTDEASRAEVTLEGAPGGLLIELGTADRHKYTRGGWATGWSQDSGAQVTASERAQVHGVSRRPVRELVVRARARAAGQRVSAYLAGQLLAGHAVATDWQIARIAIPDGVQPAGRFALTLHSTGKAPVDFDWLWLADTPGADPPAVGPRVDALALAGRPRRALLTPTARTYEFYVTPGPDDFLVFDYGGAASGMSFEVSARVDGRERERLFAASGANRWSEGAVDLSQFAGQAVALALTRAGPAGPSGWGEPAIVRRTQGKKSAPKQARSQAPRQARSQARSQAPRQAPRKVRSQEQTRPRNVIVIVIDTARADVFGPFAGTPPGDVDVATPSYDHLAATGAVFTRAYNSENWTKPSVASLLAGVYPGTHNAKYRDSVIPQELVLLPEHLRRHGFATAGFVANGYISRKFGFDKGWEAFRNYIRERRKSEAEHVYGDALSWLAERRGRPERFFLYIQTIDPHVEYRVPERFSRRYFTDRYTGPLGPSVNADEQRMLSRRQGPGSARDAAWVRALYYGEITYHDEYMGEFLRALDKLGMRDDTLIVVTNDHGEELGERGRYGHGHSLHEELVRAPLVMHFPAVFPAGQRIADAVEHVDVAPTIVDALGLPPMPGAEGQSLLPLVAGAPVSRPMYAVSEFQDGQRAIRIGPYSYRTDRDGEAHLYHLGDDGAERTDMARSHPVARRLCEVYLAEALGTPDKRQRLDPTGTRRQLVAPRLDLDPELRRELEALGYFGDD